MSVVRVGATKQYSDNWDNIFSGGKVGGEDQLLIRINDGFAYFLQLFERDPAIRLY